MRTIWWASCVPPSLADYPAAASHACQLRSTQQRRDFQRKYSQIRYCDMPELMSCPCRTLDSAIMVMKSAEDATYVLDGAMDRSVFAKRPMSPQLVVISGIL